MLRSTTVLLLLAISATAAAEDRLNYTFLQATYGQIDFKDLDVNGDAFGLGGSMAIADQFHLFADYSKASLDFDIDADLFDAGVGFNTPISDNIDVIAQLAYVYSSVSAPGFSSVDDNGFGLGVGLRALVSPQVELNGSVQYVDMSDGGNNTSLGAGFLFHINEMFAVGVGGNWDDDTSSYAIGGRLKF